MATNSVNKRWIYLQKALIAFKFISHAIIVQQYYLVPFFASWHFIFWVLSIHLIATSFAFFNLSSIVAWESAQECHPQKKNHNYRVVTVKLPNGNGNGRELGQKICSPQFDTHRAWTLKPTLSVLRRAYFRNGPNAAASTAPTLIRPCRPACGWCHSVAGTLFSCVCDLVCMSPVLCI